MSDPERRFGLLITDISMPSVSGIELLRRVRSTLRLQHLPVIVCSGLKDRQVVQDAAGLNPTHYLLKPFLPQPLRDKIDALVTEGAKS